MESDIIRAVIADHLAVPLDAVLDTATFSDLKADSLDMIQLTMRFEELLDVAIPEDESERCETVGDALHLIRCIVRDGAAGERVDLQSCVSI